ncbi:MAG TPA: transporter [Candidatus Acidoferrales bacterium]|nr:transporter [Candidatus Acidoferrales bacterium]
MTPRRLSLIVAACAAIFAGALRSAAADPLASVAIAPVQGPWSLAPGESYAELSSSSFSTSSYFDNDRHRVFPGGGDQERRVRSYVELGWKKRLSVQLDLPLVAVTQTGQAGGSVTNTGLEDLGIGLRWSLHQGRSAAAIQFRWEAPAGYDARLPLPISDGTQKLSASLQLGGPVANGFWQLGGGWRYDYVEIGSRTTDPTQPPHALEWADHATVNAAYAFWLGRLQIAGVYGADLPQATGLRNPDGSDYKVEMQAAGPRFTYRVDERLDVFAGSWHTPAGQNSLHMDEYYAGVAWKSTKLDRQRGFLGGDKRP